MVHWSAWCLALWLVSALWFDLRCRRIPNVLVVTGLVVAGLVHHGLAFAGRPSLAGASPWAPWLGALIGGAILLPGYLRAGMGAGDVKLMAMAGAFLGPLSTFWACLWVLVAGGFQAMGWWLWFRLLHRTNVSSMPFAPAVVAGVGWTLFQSGAPWW